MVWSACIVAPTKDEAIKLASNPAQQPFILRRVQLPCPYRVQMRVRPRMLRFGGELIPERRVTNWSVDATFGRSNASKFQTETTLLPPIASPVSRSTTMVRSTTAHSDIAFVEKAMESNRTKLRLAIKELQKKQSERLALEQLARQQLDVRAAERKAVERTIGYRVRAPLNQWDKGAELENIEPLIRYFDMMGADTNWFGGGDEFVDENGNIAVHRVNSSMYRIRERLWRADEKAKAKPFWSDRLNKWTMVRQRGDQTHAFWSFVHGKRLLDWVPNPARYHGCNCKGHCSHHHPDSEICPCKTCMARWQAYLDFIQRMKDRLKLLRDGKVTKEELRLARIEEARKLREYLEMMANADRLKKLAEAKARRALRSQLRPKRHENTIVSRAKEEDDGEDDFALWNESEDEELMDLARNDGDDDDINNRAELDFHDKMYEVDYETDFNFVPNSESPTEKTVSIQYSPVYVVERSPSPTPEPPEPSPPPEKKQLKVTFKLPKKKVKTSTGKKKKPKKEPAPVPPTKAPEPPPPPPVLPPVEESPEPKRTPPTPPPPLTVSSVSKFVIEVADDDDDKKRRHARQPSLFDDDTDFVIANSEPPTPIPEEPAKIKLQRPSNWGQPSTLADELSFRPSKSATKRRALDRAIKERQKAARGRKPKLSAKDGGEGEEEEPGEQLDPDWLDQFYYIQDQTIASRCRYAFKSTVAEYYGDDAGDGRLDLHQTLSTLCRVNPNLSEQETFYMTRVLELFGVDLFRGVNERLFTIMGAFSLRLTALDDWLRSMVNEIDFRLLEYKLDFCKRLWLTCSDDEKRMSEDQFRVILVAGGVTMEHERSACIKLFSQRPQPHFLDMLDFFTYIPLFIAIHMRIAYNAMDDSRTK